MKTFWEWIMFGVMVTSCVFCFIVNDFGSLFIGSMIYLILGRLNTNFATFGEQVIKK